MNGRGHRHLVGDGPGAHVEHAAENAREAERVAKTRSGDRALQQSQGFERGVAGFADYDVVVNRDAKLGGGLLDLAGHLDVGLRRRRVARGVVVHHIALDEQAYTGLR